jgi:adenylate cyclase, class 2
MPTPFEVELKLRASHAALRRRLVELGAREAGSVEELDVYYQAPHRDFAATDEALRLRRQDGERTRYLLTYKGPKLDARSKTRVEHEVEVADPEPVDAALQALGFEPAARVSKQRTAFEYQGYRVVLDEVDGLGEFVEVEGSATGGTRERILDGARRLVAALGLDPDDQIRMSYMELLTEGSTNG